MPSIHAATEPRESVLNALRELLHLLGLATIACALGVALGFASARAMRRRHVHYIWAAAPLALSVLAHGVLGGEPALVLAVGALCALARGRRWHREDVQAGGDLADVAEARVGPLGLAVLLVARLALRVRGGESLAGGRRDGALVLGRDERWRRVRIPLAGASGGTHMLVVGATGSGKTVTQTRIAAAALERGMGAVVLDPKGDAGLRDGLSRAAARAGSSFLEWTPDGGLVYNPFAAGSDTEIADKALAGERFTEPHYLRQAQRYLAHAVRALRASGSQVSLAGLVECLDPVRLELLARELPVARAGALHAYLDSLSARQRSDLAGVRDRLAILSESDVGPWLDPRVGSARSFELLGSLRAGAVVYFSLQADRRPLLSQMLAAAIVQDLQTVVAAAQSRPLAALVVIDEFSAIAAENVVRLFGRARSAGVSLLLGTQEISDLRPAGGGRLLEQVVGNLTTVIAHRQVVPRSAEMIAELAGSEGAWRVSRRSDGASTRVRTRRALLEPSRVTSLQQGWAAVIPLGAGARVRITRVLAVGQRGSDRSRERSDS